MAIANITGNILTDSGVSTSSLVSGSGTTNYLPKFTGASTLGDSIIRDSGTIGINMAPDTNVFSVTGTANNWATSTWASTTTGQSFGAIIRGGTNSSDVAFRVNNAANSSTFFTINGNGNVGIGTSSPQRTLSIANGGPTVEIDPNGGAAGPIYFNYNRSTSTYTTPEYWALEHKFMSNGGTERMRITSGGVIAIATTGKTWESSYRALELGNGFALMAHATNSDGYITSNTYYDGSWRISSQNNVRPSIFRVYDGLQLETGNSTASVGTAVATTVVFKVNISGNVTNLNNSYGQISDVSLKKDITPSTPKLDDLMKVNIVNFKFINDETEQKQIGVIAQELEEIFPSMIDIDADGLKSVKYSVFVPMLIKAIQELNDKVSALENKS
jgi:hypothetical protein